MTNSICNTVFYFLKVQQEEIIRNEHTGCSPEDCHTPHNLPRDITNQPPLLQTIQIYAVQPDAPPIIKSLHNYSNERV